MTPELGQARDDSLARRPPSRAARTATLILGTAAIVAALSFIGWDWFSARNIDVWPEWETPWTRSVDFRFNVKTPAFAEITQSQYECMFFFPAIPKSPGRLAGITVTLGLAGPLEAGNQKSFSCTPDVPPSAGGKVYVRVLYAYRTRSIWFSSRGIAQTPVYYWAPSQNWPGWSVLNDQQALSALDHCRPDGDPFNLCHGTMPDSPPLRGLSKWLVVQ
jgi:hypothetical protein